MAQQSCLCSWVSLFCTDFALSAPLRYLFFPLLFAFLLTSCSHPLHDPNHLVFVIESNPANLDPRYSSDAQSQRIDRLLFDGLVERDAQKSPKAGAFKMIRSLEAPDDHTVTFRIVPDAIVRALELRKGSADVEVSSLAPDMIPVLAKHPELSITERPGTNFAYLGINLEDPILSKREVRQALAYATDRESLIKYLGRDEARLATGLLPPNHWAYEPNVTTYNCDPAAEKLLDTAGFPAPPTGRASISP